MYIRQATSPRLLRIRLGVIWLLEYAYRRSLGKSSFLQLGSFKSQALEFRNDKCRISWLAIGEDLSLQGQSRPESTRCNFKESRLCSHYNR